MQVFKVDLPWLKKVKVEDGDDKVLPIWKKKNHKKQNQILQIIIMASPESHGGELSRRSTHGGEAWNPDREEREEGHLTDFINAH